MADDKSTQDCTSQKHEAIKAGLKAGLFFGALFMGVLIFAFEDKLFKK